MIIVGVCESSLLGPNDGWRELVAEGETDIEGRSIREGV